MPPQDGMKRGLFYHKHSSFAMILWNNEIVSELFHNKKACGWFEKTDRRLFCGVVFNRRFFQLVVIYYQLGFKTF